MNGPAHAWLAQGGHSLSGRRQPSAVRTAPASPICTRRPPMRTINGGTPSAMRQGLPMMLLAMRLPMPVAGLRGASVCAVAYGQCSAAMISADVIDGV